MIGNKKLLKQVLVFISIFTIVFFGTKYVIWKLTPTAIIVENFSKEINEKCPMMLNSDIRLEYTNANILKGKNSLLYVCTLIKEDLYHKDFNPEFVEKKTKAQAQKDFELNFDIEEYRKKDVTIYYVCYDKNKKNILGFETTSQNSN